MSYVVLRGRWCHVIVLSVRARTEGKSNDSKDSFCEQTFSHKSSYCSLVLRDVRSIFQSEFSTGRDIVLPLSISSIVSFPWGHPVAAYAFFLVFQSFLAFPITFLQSNVVEGSSYARCDQSSWPFLFVLYLGYSCPPWLFAVLLHVSHYRCNWSAFSSSTTFKNFPGISDLRSDVSTFHTIQSYAQNITLY
jgi:hypothetical protein